MSTSSDEEQREEAHQEIRSYVTGFGLAVLLTGLAFGAVAWTGLSRVTLLWTIAIAGLAQVIAHFRFFLHIDLSKSKRDDLQLILFTTLIIALMAGGTIWILSNLAQRMM